MARQTSSKTDIQNILIPIIQAVMRSGKLLYLIILGAIGYFAYQYFTTVKDNSTISYDTSLIQQQIKNVGKLVVTEGHFAEVITYKDSKKYLGNLVSFDKKAIVIVNANVTVGFDLSQVKYQIDSINKVLRITNIPKEEIKISPDIKYYDTESSRLNEFTGEDYNKINTIARANLAKKIENSTLKSNAKNRLLSELSKMLVLTNSMGWKLEYEDKEIKTEKDLGAKL
jgi:hypothetical protein